MSKSAIMNCGVGAGVPLLIGTDCPVPVKIAVPETAPALTVSVAVSPAVVEGTKVKSTVQEPETARTVPLAQVPPVRVKSEAFAPVSVKKLGESVAEAFPMLVTSTCMAPLSVPIVTTPKSRGFGVSESNGAVCMPAPVIFADLLASPKMLRMAGREPAAAGVNVRVMVQKPPARTVPLSEQVPPVRA